MTTQMKRMDVVANNVANVNSTGFKKDSVATQSFAEEFMKRLNDPGLQMFGNAVKIGKMTSGVFVDTVFTNFTSGSITTTGNALDLAIMGDGFFAVEVYSGGGASEKYTRDGEFTLADGRLVTRDGSGVLGQSGVVTIPDGDITIDERGNIYSNGVFVDTLRVVGFEDNSTLRSVKDTMFETTADSVKKDPQCIIEQTALERSNVNSAREMVDMITVNRAYEANQRSILTIDSTLQRTVNDIANKR